MGSFLTYDRATEYLNEKGMPIAESSLRRLVSQRRVPFMKVTKRVLFDPAKLDAWIEAAAVEARG